MMRRTDDIGDQREDYEHDEKLGISEKNYIRHCNENDLYCAIDRNFLYLLGLGYWRCSEKRQLGLLICM